MECDLEAMYRLLLGLADEAKTDAHRSWIVDYEAFRAEHGDRPNLFQPDAYIDLCHRARSFDM